MNSPPTRRQRPDNGLKVVSSPGHAKQNDDTRRYNDGWRAGKPVEDPEKMKRWGLISAKPSEYLICVKNGRVDPRRSGQGAHIFKWPWESVSIVPTTFQKIDFVADQITLERVGVQVSGIAVYRIVEPPLAFRVLNFSYSERASEKLSSTLREMFVGAARRLIANLALEDCLTKRKEAIATFLMQEIAPVLRGEGAQGDQTDRGWGVVVDTIEIQDVQILSEEVFEHLQAPYRSEIASRADLAELDKRRLVAERKADTEKRMAEVALESERETRMLRARTEAEAALVEAEEALRAEQAKARVTEGEIERKALLERKRLEGEQRTRLQELEEQSRYASEQRKLDQARRLNVIQSEQEKRAEEAKAERATLAEEASLAAERHAVESAKLKQAREGDRYSLESEQQLRDIQSKSEAEVRLREIETQRREKALEAEHQRVLAEIEQLLAQPRVMTDLVNTGLPRIAEAFRQSVGTVHYTHMGGGDDDAGPLGMVAGAFGQVLAVARSFGLDPAAFVKGQARDEAGE